jgi:hypothetical protein
MPYFDTTGRRIRMQAIPQRGVGLEEALAMFMQLGDLCKIEISGIGISRNSIANRATESAR